MTNHLPVEFNRLMMWSIALDHAQAIADANGAPCGVWTRDGWAVVCDTPPDDIEPDPTTLGWSLDAVVDPRDDDDICRTPGCDEPAV